MIRFANHDEAVSAMVEAVIAGLASKGIAATCSHSNKSCSTYIRASDRELRLSDHGDFHDWTGERRTIRFEDQLVTFYWDIDEETEETVFFTEDDDRWHSDCEYAGVGMDRDDFDAIVAEAVEYLS